MDIEMTKHQASIHKYWMVAALAFGLVIVNASCADDSTDSDTETTSQPQEETKADEDWNIETSPAKLRDQPIDANEGTWLNLDVSPDGTTIVFDLLGDLYLMPIDGADGSAGKYPQKLTSGIAWDMQPRFSPDGLSIAFTSDRHGKSKRAGDNIWIVDIDGKNPRQVTNETYRLINGAAWSPDGNYIVARKHFTSRRSLGAGEIWMFHKSAIQGNATGGMQLTKRPNDQKDVNEPIFSPDGKYLYYSQDTTPGSTFEYDKDSNKQIYVVKRLDLESGDTESYISGPGGACRPVPSPDGSQIAFVRRVGSKTGLHVFETRSGAVRLVYKDLERDMQEAWAIHGVYPTYAWHPDGQSIIIWAKGKIRRVQIDDGSSDVIPFHIKDTRKVAECVRFPIEVAPDEFDVKMLRWVQTSPNGKSVTYQALGHIYVRDLPDGTPRRLTSQNDHFEFYPSFSPDSRYIVYSTWNDEKLGAIRIASTDPSEAESWKLTNEPGHFSRPVFSPDGKTVVYEKGSGGSLTTPLWSQGRGIYRVETRGGESTRITKSGSKPRFSGDNERIYVEKMEFSKDADNRSLWSIGMDGQDERKHFSSSWASEYQVSPDGNWVAFIERHNVYVAPIASTGGSVQLGPQAGGIPVRKVSDQAGDWVHFSGDSKRLFWSLGPELFSCELDQTFQFLQESVENEESEKPAPTSIPIGFKAIHGKPQGVVAIVGGRIVTMGPDGVIENGTIVFENNRITKIGPKDSIQVPADAKVIDVSGQVVLPGFVDTHAHGSQAINGIVPQRNWMDYARLSFGVTTIHDPSNDTHSIFAASEMTKAGQIVAPRTFSTGTILYGATGSYKAEINQLDDAIFHLKRMKAVGAFSVKSYNQPRRDQRQQVIAAARELEMMVVPEGGSTFMHNMTMIVDGHTGIEHTLPVQSAYDDVMDLWRNTGVGYTPTLCVAYGGLSGERYWYEVDDLWLHPRLQKFIPPHILIPRSKRRSKAPREDYNHIRVAEIAKQVVDSGGLVQAGGHGQLQGICTHWELWSFVQGGMTPMESLRCGTIFGAKYLGLEGDIGSLETGKLADILVMEKDADPTNDIRESDRIHYVIANGRVFDARRMVELGSKQPPQDFYWNHLGHGMSISVPRGQGCGCQR